MRRGKVVSRCSEARRKKICEGGGCKFLVLYGMLGIH